MFIWDGNHTGCPVCYLQSRDKRHPVPQPHPGSQPHLPTGSAGGWAALPPSGRSPGRRVEGLGRGSGNPPSLLPMGAHPTPPAPRELALPRLAAPAKGTVVGPGQPAGWGSWCSPYGQNGVGGLYRVWGLPFLPPPAHSELCPLPLNSPPTHLSTRRAVRHRLGAAAPGHSPQHQRLGQQSACATPRPWAPSSPSPFLPLCPLSLLPPVSASLPSSIKTMKVIF